MIHTFSFLLPFGRKQVFATNYATTKWVSKELLIQSEMKNFRNRL